jgi:hypothetical protein
MVCAACKFTSHEYEPRGSEIHEAAQKVDRCLSICGGWREPRDFGFASAITGNIIGGTAYLLMDAFAARPQ